MRMHGLGNTYDQDGNPIVPGHRHSFMGMGADDTRSVGAAIWEFFHPGQVQEEYRAVSKEPPTYTQIWGGAFDDAMTAAYEGEQAALETGAKVADYGKNVLQLVAVIATGVAIIYVLDRFVPSKGHVKRYAGRKIRAAKSYARKRVNRALT